MLHSLLKNLFLLKALLVFLFISNLSLAATLDMQLSRDKISLGETLILSFTLNGDAHADSPDFSALEKDFYLIGTNYGKTINIVNGVSTKQSFWQVTLEPKKTGMISIPSINVGGVKSPKRQLVVQENNLSLNHNKQDTPVFVEAQISSRAPYVQSQVLYTFKLFFRTQLENSRFELPAIKDATFIQLGDGSQYQTNINGIPFYVVEKNFAFFPQKPGKLLLPPARFRAVTYDINTLINNPFSFSSPKSFGLATEKFDLSVLAIPEKFKGTTWLPANNILLTQTWSIKPDEWELGAPVTRMIHLEAYGLRGDQLPDLSIENIAGVNVYVDPAKRSNRIQDNMVVGILEQKVTYIPNLAKPLTIPTIKLNWWNLLTNAPALAQLDAVTIEVKSKPISDPTPLVNSINVPSPNLSAATNNSIKVDWFYQSIWFWITIFLAIIWFITVWLFIKTRSIHKPIKKIEPRITQREELTDEKFTQACKEGDAKIAHKFLLSWAKEEWQLPTLSLDKLRTITDDQNFKHALKTLEQIIYAKKPETWDGFALLAAYQKIKKNRKNQKKIKTETLSNEPLPPLNP